MDCRDLKRGEAIRFDSFEEIVEKVRKTYRCRKEIAERRVKVDFYHYNPYGETFRVPNDLMGKTLRILKIEELYPRRFKITFAGYGITNISKEAIAKAAKMYKQQELFQ